MPARSRISCRRPPQIRAGDWKVAPLPTDLLDRRIEITGPVDRKMVINALNSGASCFMADFEDSTSPTWENHARRADQPARRGAPAPSPSTIRPAASDYKLNDKTAVLLVRPRGWHLPEKHMRVDGQPMSGIAVRFRPVSSSTTPRS